ncbi:MAG: cytochrome b [Silicimonas sp.]
MALRNTPRSYGLIARILHWLTALLILTAFPLGFLANRTELTDGAAIERVFALFSLHKTVGIAALLIGLARIGWSLSQPRPAPLSRTRWERTLAEITHWTLSIALVAVPLTGWLAHSSAPGLAPIRWPLPQYLPFVPATPEAAALFGAIHWLVTKLLAAAILLHVAGALKHALIDRDGTLARMTSGTPAGNGTHSGTATAALTALILWIAAIGLGAALAPAPPALPETWTATDVRLALLTTEDEARIGDIPAADVTLTLAADNTGTLDIFAALDSVAATEADPLLATLPIPIAQFSGTVSGTPPDLRAAGRLDLGGQFSDIALALTRDGDTVRLAEALTLPGAPDYALRIEATFRRPAD